MARIPLPPYPKGWYLVATSPELKRGEIKPLKFFGKNLVIFRGENGKATVIDAHCPHLGANLGVGGKVVGNTIQCPFHGWKYEQSGECSSIPYCDQIPKTAKLNVYQTVEHSFNIFLHHSNEGTAPDFEVPEFEEFTGKGWSKPVFLRYNLQSHVQEMAENTLDVGHFPLVHQYYKVPEITHLLVEGSKLVVRFLGQRKVFGLHNEIDVELDARGLGIVFGKTITNVVTARVIHCATPVDENEIQVNLMFVYKSHMNPLLNPLFYFFIKREVFHFTRGDHAVLNNKLYRPEPTLCRNDGPIFRLRRWAKQFYEDGEVYAESKQRANSGV